MVVQSLSTIHRYFMENVIVQYGKCKLADAKYGDYLPNAGFY